MYYTGLNTPNIDHRWRDSWCQLADKLTKDVSNFWCTQLSARFRTKTVETVNSTWILCANLCAMSWVTWDSMDQYRKIKSPSTFIIGYGSSIENTSTSLLAKLWMLCFKSGVEIPFVILGPILTSWSFLLNWFEHQIRTSKKLLQRCWKLLIRYIFMRVFEKYAVHMRIFMFNMRWGQTHIMRIFLHVMHSYFDTNMRFVPTHILSQICIICSICAYMRWGPTHIMRIFSCMLHAYYAHIMHICEICIICSKNALENFENMRIFS